MRRAAVLIAAVSLGVAAQGRAFDWDALGAEFCARTTAGDLAGVGPLLTPALAQEIELAFAQRGAPPPTLFQSYPNVVPVCAAKTRNVALVEIRRSGAKGAAPAWTEYLVVVPEADGTTRVDDVLFATRRNDTLRSRLQALAHGG